MPYSVRKTRAGFKVVKRTSGKSLPGTSKSRAKANARIRAIEANEHGKTRRTYYRKG